MKKIFTLFAALAMVMSMSAKTIYLNTGGGGLWNQGGAKFGCHTWGSQDKSGFMTSEGGGVYSFETLDANTNVIFTRVSPSSTSIWGENGQEWNRIETTIPTDKDYCTITGWSGNDFNWSTYTPAAAYTFTKGTTLYIDFRAITDKKGANYPKAGAVGIDYSANAGGTIIPVTFTADVKWTEGEEFMKTEKGNWASIPFTVPEEGQNCAQVAADGKSYTWTTYSENCQVTVSAENGTVDGAGTFKIGTSVTLTAVPNDGYEFVNWTVGGKEVSTANPYTFTVNDNITLVANFKEAAAKAYTITTSATNGTVEGAATVVEGESVTLTATANPGYKFVNWTVGGVEVSTDNPYTFVPTEDATVVANFEQLPPETVYFVNADNWTTVNVYAWEPAANADWPGVAATKEAEQIGGYDVYSYTADAGKYAKVIFNNGTNQTDDLEWTAGKYYVIDNWYTKEEAEEKLATPVQTYDYYITGTLVGGWNPDQQGLEKDGELYKATFTDLAAGTYEFKITAGDWEHQWNYSNLGAAYEEVSQGVDGEENPNGNIKIVTEEAKNITVIFDATAGKITLEGLTEKVVVISYVLMGVGTDWTTGIAMTVNPDNANEYVLLGQEIAEGDAVKVVTLTNGVATAHCGNVDEYSVAHEFDENGNIVLAPGKYDFYFKLNDLATADDDIIYIGLSKTTALDNVNTTVAPVKAIVNGQLVIIRDGVKYNVQGAVVK